MEADGKRNSGGLARFERRIREVVAGDQRSKTAGRDLNRVVSVSPKAPWCKDTYTHTNTLLTAPLLECTMQLSMKRVSSQVEKKICPNASSWGPLYKKERV